MYGVEHGEVQVIDSNDDVDVFRGIPLTPNVRGDDNSVCTASLSQSLERSHWVGDNERNLFPGLGEMPEFGSGEVYPNELESLFLISH